MENHPHLVLFHLRCALSYSSQGTVFSRRNILLFKENGPGRCFQEVTKKAGVVPSKRGNLGSP